MPSHSALVRITDTVKSLATSGASAATTTMTASASALVRPLADRDHAGLPYRPSGRTASTPTSSAKVTRIE